MFKTLSQSTPDHSETKGAKAKANILATAVRLFREHGFDQTTMRDVARAAGMSVGAAYHYFPSKEAMVMAYYEDVQARHAALARERCATLHTLRERLATTLEAGLDVIVHDRAMLHVVMRTVADRDSPLSVLGDGTAAVRAQSMQIYRDALKQSALPPELVPLAERAVWALHMGINLYFFYDESSNAERTRVLLRRAAYLAADLLTLASSPMARPFALPMVASVQTMLREADLLPSVSEQGVSL